MKNRIKQSFIALILILVSNPSFANIDGATAYIENTTAKVFNITTQQKEISVIRNELVEYIRDNIDIKWMSKFVLGKYWKQATAQQKEKFTPLFEKYLIYNYAPKFQGYNNEQYEIVETKEVAKGKYVSQVKLILTDKSEFLLKIFILQRKNIYKIVDISGEGVSFSATQRAEFGSMIATNGLEEFLVILEKKVEVLAKSYNNIHSARN